MNQRHKRCVSPVAISIGGKANALAALVLLQN
jgi:hypothetical protein